jgi:hypothetical protein
MKLRALWKQYDIRALKPFGYDWGEREGERERAPSCGHAPRANVQAAHLKFQGQSAFVPVQCGSYNTVL